MTGKFKAASGTELCIDCPAGKYEHVMGSTVCKQCVAGTYTINPGSDACIDCESGKYSTTVGATSDVCQACPANSIAPQGSNELTDCICDAGYTGSNGGTETMA